MALGGIRLSPIDHEGLGDNDASEYPARDSERPIQLTRATEVNGRRATAAVLDPDLAWMLGEGAEDKWRRPDFTN